MKILLTGAAGFIGSHTAERLCAMGHQVIGVDNFSEYYDISLKKLNAEALTDAGITVMEMDLRTANLKEKLQSDFDIIFHFAAHPGISANSTFEDYFSNNILATQHLIEYAEGCSNKPFFVNIATSSIYGLEATFPEDVPPKPASWYGVTKLAAEQLVLAKSRENKIKATSLRLYSVYGPRERPDKLYTSLIDCALNDKPFPLFDGSEKHLRSFTYVQDIVDGIVSVIGKEDLCNGEIFNLGTEVENTTAQGIAAVEEILQKKIKTENKPPRAGDQSRTKANIDKARKLLNYNPKTTLMEGLEAQVLWFKENFM
ncbi:NAD-dependent epimerase/dehydratase family protein [Aequorivita echinoideorum]|uniref:NAD-dependent epimerase/dehydratase family protein n=1 Tax=Aequorivita echinoideorum TaxID=1549647 RepID=A0ABS5S9V5_9FLAO|nr:NAD-dependent epimerase/dehydratase family protein [Aequorivita echinoideorum]MBT0608650.1 NAD-dependent epimerase/dehydratase family protein [Aequorivita echinoideorum]